MERIIDIGHGLNLERAEAAVATLAVARDRMPAVVDLRQCQHVDVGASWLLGNALAHFRGSEHLTVQVPDPGKFSGDWFLHFTRTGLGHAIAKHASVILGPHEQVTAQVRAYYGREGEWLARNFGFVDDLHRGALDPDNEVRFAMTLEGFFAKAGYHIALSDATSQLTPLGRFLFESVQNVYDHAARRPLQLEPRSVLSYVSAARYAKIPRPKSMGHPFSDYPARAAAGGPFNGFVVVTVCDDGNGMAARHSLDSSVCTLSYQTERRTVADALLPGHSVKLLAHDCEVRGDPGFGLARIAAALKTLGAFATIRTGRVLITFDATAEAQFQVAADPAAELPGTAIQVVFPNTQAIERQLSLPLA